MIDNELLSRAKASIDERRENRYKDDMRKVLDLPEGRRLVWHVLSLCGVMSASMRTNPYDTAYREGQRSVGLEFMGDIMENQPEMYDRMRREHASNAKADEAELSHKIKILGGTEDD